MLRVDENDYDCSLLRNYILLSLGDASPTSDPAVTTVYRITMRKHRQADVCGNVWGSFYWIVRKSFDLVLHSFAGRKLLSVAVVTFA